MITLRGFLITFLLSFSSIYTIGQNRHLSLGIKGNGMCFGNSAYYNGIRLNIWDKNVDKINGLNISFLSRSKKQNGISLGILASYDTISNGIRIGGLATMAKKNNGVALAGLIMAGEKYNGIGIAGLSPTADTLNGVFVGLWGVTPWSQSDSIQVINGLAIGGIGVRSIKLNGIAISGLMNLINKQKGISISCFNSAKELHGVQFGLLNYAGNNRRIFRWLPFFNMHLKKEKLK